MSTAPPTGFSPGPSPSDIPEFNREIRIISHSNLFYWWPVWGVGFLMALLTFMSGQRMVPVPKNYEYFPAAEVRAENRRLENKPVLVLSEHNPAITREPLWVTGNKNLGVLFSIVLLLVIAITNIPLRGLWS